VIPCRSRLMGMKDGQKWNRYIIISNQAKSNYK
jgi:hypothetical protein